MSNIYSRSFEGTAWIDIFMRACVGTYEDISPPSDYFRILLMRGSFISLFVVLFCMIASCSHLTGAIYPTKDDLIKTVYIDKEFNPEKEAWIIEAIQEIECKTNSLVKLTVVKNFDTSRSNLLPNNALVIKLVDGNDKDIQESDANIAPETGVKTIGLYINGMHEAPSTILLVDERLFGQSVYRGVAIHEILHSIGMDHINDHGSVMYWRIDQSPMHMTSVDVAYFCGIYSCNPDEFKNQCD